MGGHDLAEAAAGLVGSPFRLHGRDPLTGLDCIGLLAAALVALGRRTDFPTGYQVRTDTFAGLASAARDHGFEPVSGPAVPGDVLFVKPGPAQLHLVIAAVAPGQFIEAHAGIGRVVVRPGPMREPIIQHWRLAASA